MKIINKFNSINFFIVIFLGLLLFAYYNFYKHTQENIISTLNVTNKLIENSITKAIANLEFLAIFIKGSSLKELNTTKKLILNNEGYSNVRFKKSIEETDNQSFYTNKNSKNKYIFTKFDKKIGIEKQIFLKDKYQGTLKINIDVSHFDRLLNSIHITDGTYLIIDEKNNLIASNKLQNKIALDNEYFVYTKNISNTPWTLYYYISIYSILFSSLYIIISTLIIMMILIKLKKLIKNSNQLKNEFEKETSSYKFLFEHSTDGILLIKNKVFFDCNKAILKMLKYDIKEELINIHPSEISPFMQKDGQESSIKADKMMNIAMKNGYHKFEWIHKRKNNKEFWCEVTLTTMYINGGDIIHVALKDISSVKKIEQIALDTIAKRTQEYLDAMKKAKDENNAKTEFLANMSHEIRTPLNAILGFIEILKENSKDSASLEFIDIIQDSSNSLLNIIEDILDFSKIESGKLVVEHIDFNLKEEFSVITYLFDAKCSQKNINLELNFASNLPIDINSDPLRIKQVIANLLSNAIKFSRAKDKIYVDISYENEILFVSVKDKGIGIAKDKQEHIFEAFNQEDSSTTRNYGGTGLGLSISSELCKLLGGELKVKSKVGVGSNFYFSIPARTAKMIKKDKKEKVVSSFKNNKILLVEDNKANQMYMKVILKKLELDYDLAIDGLEAIAYFKTKKYDLILMDENMPNMNGIEATKKIIEFEKENNLKHTAIIALTANALKGDRKKFMSVGMDEYITKPIKQDKLTEILSMFL